MNKLTDIKPVEYRNGTLTGKTSAEFIVAFKYKLIRNYTFSDLQTRDIKKLQDFLDK